MAQTDDPRTDKKPSARVSAWLTEIKDAKQREQTWRKDGQRILDIYDGTKSKTTPFNILFSNTETLLPAVYSTVPRPVVEQRHKDSDPLGHAAALAGQKGLEFMIDTNMNDYDSFDTAMKSVVLDASLPGRGQASLLYDATITGDYEEGEEGEGAPEVKNEMVCLETKHWDRVYYGYAKTWSKVPWVAYEEYIDEKEAARLFGKATAKKLQYTTDADETADDSRSRSAEDQHKGQTKTACVYTIWDKAGGKKVIYVSPAYADDLLKEMDDPLNLSGFFPCPEPLMFIDKTHTLIPTAPYTMYENQAIELNKIQQRINRLIDACKVRGLYDSGMAGDIQKLFAADENALLPAETPSALAAEKGLQNAIWFPPFDPMRAMLEQLYTAREACKQVIYEITGISDILRGASEASETATAQKIKNTWGTLRLKRMQKAVAEYARQMLRLMLELAASKLSEETWKKMTGLPFITSQEAQQAQQVAQAAQMSGQPVPPDVQAALQQPVWSQVLQVLKDDLTRAYRVDIETNSTVEIEATEDQEKFQQMMGALGQFLSAVAPLVANGSMPFEVAKNMLLIMAHQYPRYGTEIEDAIKQMQPPQPQGDDGKAQEQALQAKQQQMEQAQQMKDQQGQMQLQVKTMEAEKKLLEKDIDLQLREIQLKANEEKFALAQQVADQKLQMKEQVHTVKTSAADQVRTLKDKTSQQTTTTSKQAETKLAASADAITQVTDQMSQLNSSLLTAIQEQAQQTEKVLSQLTAMMTAPRIKKAIRGKDGRIEAMEETVQA